MMACFGSISGLVLLFLLGPLVVAVASAFGSTIYLVFPPHGVTLHWFRAALVDPDYRRAFLTSIEVACLATAGSMLLGLPAAYALARGRFPKRDILESVLLLPLLLPVLALSIAMATLFSHLGIAPSRLRLAMCHLVLCTPYVIRVVTPALRGVDPRLEGAARTLGASSITAVVLVTFPAIRPSLIVAGLLSFLVSFDEFDLALFLTPPQAPTLPVLLFSRAEYGIGATVAAAAGLLILLASAAMAVAQVVAFSRRARKRTTASGLGLMSGRGAARAD